MKEKIAAYLALGLGVSTVAAQAVPAFESAQVSAAHTDSSTANLLAQKLKDYQRLQFLPSFRPAEQLTAVSEPIVVNGVGTFYPSTGRSQGFGVEGFMISKPMNSFYQKNEGNPISRQYIDTVGRLSQGFEKEIKQLMADGKGSYSVSYLNIFDELSKSGKDEWLETVRSTPKSFDWPSDIGKPWGHTSEGPLSGTIEENHVKILDPYPVLKTAYLSNPYWFEQYGLPMAVKDYGTFIATRTQRSVLQLWMVDAPWANKGQVVVANGGEVATESGVIIPLEASKPDAIDNDIVFSIEGGRMVGRRETKVSYYSQFAQAEGIPVRAPASVRPSVLQQSQQTTTLMMRNLHPEVKATLLAYKTAISIFPADRLVNDLPEFQHVTPAAVGSPLENVAGLQLFVQTRADKNMIAVGEKYFINGIPGSAESEIYHELGHGIQQAFTSAQMSEWDGVFNEAFTKGTLYDRFCVQNNPRCSQEFWAAVSVFYFANRDKLRRENPTAFGFAQNIYR